MCLERLKLLAIPCSSGGSSYPGYLEPTVSEDGAYSNLDYIVSSLLYIRC